MECPKCAAAGELSRLIVRDTRQDATVLRINRRRVCEQNKDHVYETIEHLGELRLDQQLERLGVRRSSDHVITGAFSKTRLAEDIRVGVLHRLPEPRVQAVVNDVIAEVEANLPHLQKASPDTEAGKLFVGVIDDVDLVDIVERRLGREAHDTVRALYRLAKRPFKTTRDARAFLVWLCDEGAYRREDITDRADNGAAQKWYPPGIPLPQPTWVLDATDYASPFDLKRSQFDLGRVERSVARLFEGRNNSRINSSCTVHWVLWELAGQETVLRTQLAVGVGQCVRRVDDIAYLRWAGVAKDVNDMAGLVSEAEALLRYPSRRLSFTREAMPEIADSPWHVMFPSNAREEHKPPRPRPLADLRRLRSRAARPLVGSWSSRRPAGT
jgi:transcriptional regulator NrdR family protein